VATLLVCQTSSSDKWNELPSLMVWLLFISSCSSDLSCWSKLTVSLC